jgi:hypothetical protein
MAPPAGNLKRGRNQRGESSSSAARACTKLTGQIILALAIIRLADTPSVRARLAAICLQNERQSLEGGRETGGGTLPACPLSLPFVRRQANAPNNHLIRSALAGKGKRNARHSRQGKFTLSSRRRLIHLFT